MAVYGLLFCPYGWSSVFIQGLQGTCTVNYPTKVFMMTPMTLHVVPHQNKLISLHTYLPSINNHINTQPHHLDTIIRD